MGHPPSDERLEFTNLEISCGNGMFWHICKHCDRAYEASKQPTGTYALSEPKKMKGRIETFKSHLKHCPHFIAYVKARANANPLPGDDSARSTSNGSRFHADDVLSQVNPKRQKRIDEYFVGISEEEERNQLNRHLLEFQADSNLPENVVVCYLDIFAGFSERLHGTENLIREVEKRWRQCEQPLMLLALFLHPGHREAAEKLLNQSPLTTTGSLCRIGLYYFRRFNRKSEDRLYEDLHNWIKGEDDTILPFAGFSSLHNYWDCMQSDMPDSKLPVLAITILSIAVNTATCERYFSELALIHTAKRNRMSPEKAQKLALVRKRVRESNACGDRSKSSHLRRLTDPKERTRLRDRDDRFECNTNEEEEEETFVGPDGAFEYWRMVLCELEGDDDPPVALNNNDTYDTSTSQARRLAQ
ncbi:hypothetical protein PR003_g3903 [Phytophthora rubi]|uniref:HAT C-terminal dimerisation domain-containing protein n=1 Tax=Phytophthora rubi TaxID=129364 RepID=A0A6A4FNR1_9STRA|nr:hypothetical protein PR003_g3903 [Phytophthora rubi]